MLITHVTEFTVLVALMGVGLAIDRPLDLAVVASWRTWSPVWRLLAGRRCRSPSWRVAVLGWWVAGLAPAVALLLGAVLAPTDPVLASDVQVGEPPPRPTTRTRGDEDDDIRFSLTAEAGLNDGLAFPFVHLALLLLIAGGFTALDAGAWLGWYVLGKIALGVAVGLAAGWLLGRQAFHVPQHAPAAGRARRAAAGARRTAGVVRRRGAGRRLRLPRGLRLRDAPARVRARRTPTSVRCTPSSSGSSG